MTCKPKMSVRQQAVQNRIDAINDGRKTYEGRICRKHQICTRFCRNHCCVKCRAEKLANQAEARKNGEFKRTGPSFWDQQYKPKRNVQWPSCNFRDDITPPAGDGVPYRTNAFHTPLRYASVAANVAES